MFSSLPSASKIYVNSNKIRQKHPSSTKKKRKKTLCNSFISEVGAGVDTLIASSVKIKDEDEFSSGKDSSGIDSPDRKCENFTNAIEKEISFEETDNDKIYVESNDVHFCNSNSVPFADNDVDKIEYDVDKIEYEEGQNDHDKYDEIDVNQQTQAAKELHDSACINQNQIFDLNVNEGKVIVTDDLCSKPGNIVCIDQQTQDYIQECQSDVFGNDDPGCLISTAHLSKDSNLDVNQNVPEVTVEAVLPATVSDEDECAVLNEGFHIIDFDLKSSETETSILVDFDNSHHEKSDITLDDSLLSAQFNDLTKNLSSDSASVRSDCCLATNIYDERTELIECENTSDQEEHCTSDSFALPQMQSPEQSELSCTESARSENKNGDTISESSVSSEKPDISNADTAGSPVKHEHQKNGTSTSKDDIINPHISSDGSLDCKNISSFSQIFSRSLPNLSVLKESTIKFQYKSLSHLKKPANFSDKSTITTDIQYSLENNKKECETCQSNKKEFKSTNKESVEQIANSVDSPSESRSLSTFKSVSSTVMKILPPVAMLQARSRSYVFGSIGPSGSLLGNEELLRFFPDKKVSIFMGTWNMNGHDPPENIDDFLLPLDISSLPDIYAVGIQESMQSRSEWEILIQTTLGPSHVLFTSSSLGVLHLSIFLRRDLIWFCSVPEDASVATRPGSMVKTKGAVAICFTFFGTSFLFVNSHLTAHEQKLKERLLDYEKICEALDLPKSIPRKSHHNSRDVTSRFDCVFWAGDLNFRVTKDRHSVLSFVEERNRKCQPSDNSLMKHDQLCIAMAEGSAFHGFKEGIVNFNPSYKFDVGTSSFDSTKQRVPSYTDRILYRCREKSSIYCVHYNAVSSILTSDHKPVFGVFNVTLKPGRDNVPLAAGMFKREVYLEAIKRRAHMLEVVRNHKQSTICSVM